MCVRAAAQVLRLSQQLLFSRFDLSDFTPSAWVLMPHSDKTTEFQVISSYGRTSSRGSAGEQDPAK